MFAQNATPDKPARNAIAKKIGRIRLLRIPISFLPYIQTENIGISPEVSTGSLNYSHFLESLTVEDTISIMNALPRLSVLCDGSCGDALQVIDARGN